jgi:hypothetical protein
MAAAAFSDLMDAAPAEATAVETVVVLGGLGFLSLDKIISVWLMVVGYHDDNGNQ